MTETFLWKPPKGKEKEKRKNNGNGTRSNVHAGTRTSNDRTTVRRSDTNQRKRKNTYVGRTVNANALYKILWRYRLKLTRLRNRCKRTAHRRMCIDGGVCDSRYDSSVSCKRRRAWIARFLTGQSRRNLMPVVERSDRTDRDRRSGISISRCSYLFRHLLSISRAISANYDEMLLHLLKIVMDITEAVTRWRFFVAAANWFGKLRSLRDQSIR